MRITKHNQVITSLQDWESNAGPKSKGHWVDDRSAKEVARAWLASGEQLPPEVSAAFAGDTRFGPVLDWWAEPEAKLQFDDFAGEPRNSDLAVHAQDSNGAYLIAVEAKADESYGGTVAQTLRDAKSRLEGNPRSNGLSRVRQLLEAFFGADETSVPDLLGIRYQLLTASAGALCEAERRGYSRAVLLIHEFITEKTTDENHARNTQDLQNFMNALSPEVVSQVVVGKLYGPFSVPGGKILKSKIELYIGKVTRNLRPAGSSS